MAERHDKGSIQADIPTNAIDEALASVERISRGEAGEVPPDPAPPPAEGTGEGEGGVALEVEGGETITPEELASLRAQLELSQEKGRETLEKLKDQHDRFLRAAADLENYKKRAAKEREEVQKFGVEKLLKDLLPSVDGLDRALAAAPEGDPLTEGVKLVRASLEQALARHGAKGFSAMGKPFDPAQHEALMQVPTADQPPGTVVLEHARGWTLNDRLLRPAMVGVAVAVPEGAATHEG
jgi:molecular chaperone GrpE